MSSIALGLGMEFDPQDLAEHFTLESLEQNAQRVDCQDPRAQRCYRLLHRALSDEDQMTYGFPADEVAKLQGLGPVGESAIVEALDSWQSKKKQDATFVSESLLGNVAAAAADGSSLRERLNSVYDAWFDESTLTARERHRRASAELVAMIDIALALGDTATYRDSMVRLEQINPSAHAAVRCLAGVDHMAALLPEPPKGRPADGAAVSVPVLKLLGLRPDEEIRGAITGILYIKRANRQLPYTDALTGFSILLGFVGIAVGVWYAGWVRQQDAKRQAAEAAERRRQHQARMDQLKKLEDEQRKRDQDIMERLKQMQADIDRLREEAAAGSASTTPSGSFSSPSEPRGSGAEPAAGAPSSGSSDFPTMPAWPVGGPTTPAQPIRVDPDRPFRDLMSAAARKKQQEQFRVSEASTTQRLEDHPEYGWIVDAQRFASAEAKLWKLLDERGKFRLAREHAMEAEELGLADYHSLQYEPLEGKLDTENCLRADPAEPDLLDWLEGLRAFEGAPPTSSTPETESLETRSGESQPGLVQPSEVASSGPADRGAPAGRTASTVHPSSTDGAQAGRVTTPE